MGSSENAGKTGSDSNIGGSEAVICGDAAIGMAIYMGDETARQKAGRSS